MQKEKTIQERPTKDKTTKGRSTKEVTTKEVTTKDKTTKDKTTKDRSINEKSTKEKILDATLELATEQGIGSVSLSQIAKKVGIQKPSLYNHFASKEEIMDGLYEYLRLKARNKVVEGTIDYGELVKGKSALEVLTMTVKSYISMNEDKDMNQFYRFIMSERSINKEAASIMVAETEKMVLATKQLFYAMQAQNIIHFQNVDMAAFSFAMVIHSIIDFRGDQIFSEQSQTAEQLLNDYLKDFCQIYEMH